MTAFLPFYLLTYFLLACSLDNVHLCTHEPLETVLKHSLGARLDHVAVTRDESVKVGIKQRFELGLELPTGPRQQVMGFRCVAPAPPDAVADSLSLGQCARYGLVMCRSTRVQKLGQARGPKQQGLL